MTENETVRLFLTHQEAHYLHAAVGLWTRAELRRGKSPHLTRLQDVLSVIVCDDLSQPLFVWTRSGRSMCVTLLAAKRHSKRWMRSSPTNDITPSARRWTDDLGWEIPILRGLSREFRHGRQ